MRKLCPNFDHEDGLDTVLEVPVPEEMFGSSNKSAMIWWQNMKWWMKNSSDHHNHHQKPHNNTVFGTRNAAEIQLLLGVIGAPLVPLPISSHSDYRIVKDHPIESSMGKYIVKQYIAAVGGEKAVNSIESMYAMGKVKMKAKTPGTTTTATTNNAEVGGFVLWQKGPELWCLELVVSGCKISAGSDGKLAWRQTPWHHSHASRGPPRPLRRFLQGLDPKSTANLFSSDSVCVGEKAIDGHDCFVLKLEADPAALRSRSTPTVRMIRHTLWGYFSQRTGLLIHLRDSHLLTIRSESNNNNEDNVFWETTMESFIHDYRAVDGVAVAHSGRTAVSLFRFGESSHTHSNTRMEEVWEIEEVDFNIKGLSMDCFLPPGDLKKDHLAKDHHLNLRSVVVPASESRLPYKIRSASFRIGAARVAAIDVDEHEQEHVENVISTSTTDDDDDDEEDDQYHL